MLDDCPSVVVDDHNHCWNSMNENLVGIGVTSPMFSDGSANYEPGKWLQHGFAVPYQHTFTVLQ